MRAPPLTPRVTPFAALTVVLALMVGTLSTSRIARADSPFEGKWVQGPMKEEYTVLKWQKECESPPVERVVGRRRFDQRVRRGGRARVPSAAGRVFKTNLCYDQMPTLQRESHTRSPSGREWRTRCTTPANDPRHAVMNTLVVATTDTHIDVIETGRYESQLVGGLCTADVKRSRSFDLVAPADQPPRPRSLLPRSLAPETAPESTPPS